MTTTIGGEGGTPVPAGRIAEYFSSLEKQGISINFGSYFSETQTRTAVLGMSARKPNADELSRMRAIMDTAMRAGAMGMTTALIYPPSSYSTTDELVEVAKAAAKYGGVYASHMRDEGQGIISAINELIAVAERAGMPAGNLSPQGRVQTRLGNSDGLRSSDGRCSASTRCRRRGRHVCVYRGRHRPRSDDSELGARGRYGFSKGALGESSDSRAYEERNYDGLAGLVEHHRGRRWLGRHRPRECAQSVECQVRAADDRKYCIGCDSRPCGRCVGFRRAGKGTRDGDLSHDGRSGHRDCAGISVDEHWERRWCRCKDRRDRSNRSSTPAQLSKFSAR